MISRSVIFEEYVGRSEELAYLVDVRARTARANAGAIVTVVGEPGVGKSRLLAELRRATARERGAFVRVRCDEVTTRPFAPLVEAIDELARARALLGRSALDRAREALTATAPYSAIDSDEQKYRRFEAFAHAIEDSAARLGHLTLALDDAHWSDISSLEALRPIAEKISKLPLLLIVSYRQSEIERDPRRALAIVRLEREGADRISLGALDARAISQLVAAALPKASPLDVRRVVDLAEGRPYVAEELARNLADRDAASGALAVPASLRAAVLERCERLDERARHVLTRASILGRTFDIDDVAALGEPLRDILGGLRSARDLQLVVETDVDGDVKFRFRHALTREVLYRAMLEHERRELHDTMARHLEGLADPSRLGELAYHALAAGDERRACDAGERAGDYAMEVSGFGDAATSYERALAAAGDDAAARARLAGKAAKAMYAAGRLGEAVDLLSDAVDRLTAAKRPNEALTLRVEALRLCLVSTTDLARARTLKAAIDAEVTEAVAPALRFEIEYLTSLIHNSAGEIEGAIAALDRAEAVFPDAPPRRLASLHIGRGNANRRLLRIDEAERWYRSAREMLEAGGFHDVAAVAILGLGANEEYRERYDRALELYAEAEATFVRLRHATRLWETRANIAQLALSLGDIERGRRLIADADRAGVFEMQRWIGPRVMLARLTGADADAVLALTRHSAKSLTSHGVSLLAVHVPWMYADPAQARGLVDRLVGELTESSIDGEIATTVAAFGSDATLARVRGSGARRTASAVGARRVPRVSRAARIAHARVQGLRAAGGSSRRARRAPTRSRARPSLGRRRAPRERGFAHGRCACGSRANRPRPPQSTVRRGAGTPHAARRADRAARRDRPLEPRHRRAARDQPPHGRNPPRQRLRETRLSFARRSRALFYRKLRRYALTNSGQAAVSKALNAARTAAAFATTRAKAAPSICCAASESALSGCGCTSTIAPSSPAAAAASTIGSTSVRRPLACEGSTITGRCVSSLRRSAPPRSSTLRVCESKLRMPRSHSTTRSLPSTRMYSAASKSSSSVAERPRLSKIGRPVRAAARSSGTFCMLRAPI
jgi:hypothetical protein